MDIPLTDILKKISSGDDRLEIYYDHTTERVLLKKGCVTWNNSTFEEVIASFIGSHIRGDRK